MENVLEDSAVMQKTMELCQSILDDPAMKSMRQRIDAFMDDEKSRTQYEDLVSKGQALQEKQQAAIQLSGAEIEEFEAGRRALLENPVARGFIDAQEEMQQVQQSIQSYVRKTIELGRIPTADELSCGHGGCGCGSGGGGCC